MVQVWVSREGMHCVIISLSSQGYNDKRVCVWVHASPPICPVHVCFLHVLNTLDILYACLQFLLYSILEMNTNPAAKM